MMSNNNNTNVDANDSMIAYPSSLGGGNKALPADLGMAHKSKLQQQMSNNKNNNSRKKEYVQLKTKLWDAQKLARIILGRDPTKTKSHSNGNSNSNRNNYLLEAIRAFAEMKQELNLLRQQTQQIRDVVADEEPSVSLSVWEAQQQRQQEYFQEDAGEETKSTTIQQQQQKEEQQNILTGNVIIKPTKIKSLGVGVIADLEQRIIQWQVKFQELNRAHETQMLACQADLERLHLRLEQQQQLLQLQQQQQSSFTSSSSTSKIIQLQPVDPLLLLQTQKELDKLVSIVCAFPGKSRIAELEQQVQECRLAEQQAKAELAESRTQFQFQFKLLLLQQQQTQTQDQRQNETESSAAAVRMQASLQPTRATTNNSSNSINIKSKESSSLSSRGALRSSKKNFSKLFRKNSSSVPNHHRSGNVPSSPTRGGGGGGGVCGGPLSEIDTHPMSPTFSFVSSLSPSPTTGSRRGHGGGGDHDGVLSSGSDGNDDIFLEEPLLLFDSEHSSDDDDTPMMDPFGNNSGGGNIGCGSGAFQIVTSQAQQLLFPPSNYSLFADNQNNNNHNNNNNNNNNTTTATLYHPTAYQSPEIEISFCAASQDADCKDSTTRTRPNSDIMTEATATTSATTDLEIQVNQLLLASSSSNNQKSRTKNNSKSSTSSSEPRRGERNKGILFKAKNLFGIKK